MRKADIMIINSSIDWLEASICADWLLRAWKTQGIILFFLAICSFHFTIALPSWPPWLSIFFPPYLNLLTLAFSFSCTKELVLLPLHNRLRSCFCQKKKQQLWLFALRFTFISTFCRLIKDQVWSCGRLLLFPALVTWFSMGCESLASNLSEENAEMQNRKSVISVNWCES